MENSYYKNKVIRILFALVLIVFSLPLWSWEKELAIGFGSGKEINQNYRNQGIILLAKILKLPKIDDTLFATIDVSASELHAHTANHKILRTLAIAIAPRAYFTPPEHHPYRPYLQASLGPCYLSSKQFGTRAQGANIAFQITLETGIEIDLSKCHGLDFNIRLVHFCNAGIFDPNEAINLFPVLSIGYLFG